MKLCSIFSKSPVNVLPYFHNFKKIHQKKQQRIRRYKEKQNVYTKNSKQSTNKLLKLKSLASIQDIIQITLSNIYSHFHNINSNTRTWYISPSVSVFLSFFGFFQFSEYRSFVCLVRFIPRYCILFVAVISRIVSLLSLLHISLLVYRNARDFCVLILYPATLPNSLMSSISFLVAFLGLSTEEFVG